jgi:hypothetical protein
MKKTSKPSSEDRLVAAHVRACKRLCGKGSEITNYGWFQSKDRWESKVFNYRTDKGYVVVTKRLGGRLIHYRIHR